LDCIFPFVAVVIRTRTAESVEDVKNRKSTADRERLMPRWAGMPMTVDGSTP
jgi:hypothetical protein